MSPHEAVIARLEDQRPHDEDENAAHEARAVLHRHVRAQHAAHHVGHRQRQREVPPHLALGREQDQRGDVGREVQQLGRGRGVQEVVAQQPHEQEHEETARSRTEESVVEPDRQTDQAGHAGFGGALEAWRMVLAEILARQGVEQHGQQDEGQDPAQEVHRHHGDRPRPGEPSREARGGGRQQRLPAYLHAAAVLPGGDGGAPDRAALVGAQQGGRRRVGKGGEQRGHQDEPAAAHDGIHETGQQRCQRNNDPFHPRIVSPAMVSIACRQKKAPGSPALGETGHLVGDAWNGVFEFEFVSSAPSLRDVRAIG